LQEAALGIVIESGEAQLGVEVLQLMERTPNRDIQYDCIRALSTLTGTGGPSYRDFMEAPERYINHWRQVDAEVLGPGGER
jgi:hypothetical protein